MNLRGIIPGLLILVLGCGSLIDEASRLSQRYNEKNGTGTPAGGAAPRSSAKAITSFYLDQAVSGLSASYSGVIVGTSIAMRIPYGVGVNALRPGFTISGCELRVAGVLQTSGVTINNFTTTVVYTVVAEDGSTQNYNVSVVRRAHIQDTGQATCYGMGTTVACSNATFPAQDGDFLSTPNARSVATPTTNVGFAADFINRDTLNGIAWRTCVEGLSASDCSAGTASTQSQSASAGLCTALNSANSGAGYAGLQTWRAPTAVELMQLTHYANSGVFYDAANFLNAAGSFVWSTTAYGSPLNGVVIGNVFGSSAQSGNFRARCVAGAAYPTASWTDLGDGSVRDEITGLIWQKCAGGQANDATCTGTAGTTGGTAWGAALTECKNLTLGGRSWRLPNMIESLTLFDFSTVLPPHINTANFPNFPPAGSPAPQMWTSTTLVSNSSYAYVVNYATVSAGTIDAKNATSTGSARYYGRCVSGP